MTLKIWIKLKKVDQKALKTKEKEAASYEKNSQMKDGEIIIFNIWQSI